MNPAKWAPLAAIGVVSIAPLLWMAGCGNQATSVGGGDGSADKGSSSGGSDATTSGDGNGNGNGTSNGAAGSDGSSGAGGDDGNGGASSGASSGGASSGGASSGSSNGASSGTQGSDGGTCVPVTSCPTGVTCGRYTDPCSGVVFACGSVCPTGQLCMPDPGNPTSQSCLWKGGTAGVCGTQCGEIGFDACGVAIDCGVCTGGQACVDNQCVTPPPPSDAGAAANDACVPTTCTPDSQTQLCGTVNDGCGHTLHCSCTTGMCIGGVCAAEPPECSQGDGGAKCGSVTNACGSGTIACTGTCTGLTKCVAGSCTACTPPSCGTAVCGSAPSNGCGPAVSCGTCPGSTDVCTGGACCTPSTCAQAVDAGASGCTPVNLGCGVQKSCAPCISGEVCSANACCTPKTCADALDAGTVDGCAPVDLGCGVHQTCSPCPGGESCAVNACVTCTPKTCADFSGGCGHSDGCGGTLDCCGEGNTCQGGSLCCGNGMVEYSGACCLPSCNTHQPPGTQISCGQVLYCSGGT